MKRREKYVSVVQTYTADFFFLDLQDTLNAPKEKILLEKILKASFSICLQDTYIAGPHEAGIGNCLFLIKNKHLLQFAVV